MLLQRCSLTQPPRTAVIKNAFYLAKRCFWAEEHNLLDQTIYKNNFYQICIQWINLYFMTSSLYTSSRKEKTTTARALWPSRKYLSTVWLKSKNIY